MRPPWLGKREGRVNWRWSAIIIMVAAESELDGAALLARCPGYCHSPQRGGVIAIVKEKRFWAFACPRFVHISYINKHLEWTMALLTMEES